MEHDEDIRDADAFELREQVRNAAAPLPDPVRDELFGDVEKVAPSVIVESAEHATVFRGVNGSPEMAAAKRELTEAAQQIADDPKPLIKRYEAALKRRRGVPTPPRER